MTNLTLYHNGPSTCSQKVRLILELKKLPYESKEVNLLAGEQHDPEYVKLNPNHVVPTLVTDNGVLIDSFGVDGISKESSLFILLSWSFW